MGANGKRPQEELLSSSHAAALPIAFVRLPSAVYTL